MIDHEFRIVTPIIKKIIKEKYNNEKILYKKIPYFVLQNNYLEKANKKYLGKAKLIKGIYYRGLPINNKKNYFEQENQLQENFYLLKDMLRAKFFGKQIIQIPNPDLVSFSSFKKNIKRFKNFCGFEVIPSWHGKNINNKCYKKFLNYVQETGLPLSLEVDYLYRNTHDSLHHFFSIIKSFPRINYWLPHLGCGVFLHWKRVNDICKFQPSLLSSTNDLSNWNVILKNKFLKSLPIKFASDHPFNGLDSLKIYNTWIKNFKK